MRSFDVFFDLRLIKRPSKHSRGWWFETLSRPLQRYRAHYNVIVMQIDPGCQPTFSLFGNNFIISNGEWTASEHFKSWRADHTNNDNFNQINKTLRDKS